MKNNYQILCFLLIISYINSQTCTGITPSKAEDCKDDSIPSTMKEKYDFTHCCYKELENLDGGKSCTLLTTRQYKNIGKYIKLTEEQNDYDYKMKIDCNSYYLKFYLLSLILFLI